MEKTTTQIQVILSTVNHYLLTETHAYTYNIQAKCERRCLKSQSPDVRQHVKIFFYMFFFFFFQCPSMGAHLHLFLALVFTGKRRFVQVFVLWLQGLMSPCYQSSSEITVSGSGKICRHGDKPVSCRLGCGDPPGRMTLFSESRGDVYPLIPVTRGRQTEGKHHFLGITLLHQAEADFLYIYSPNMTQ